MDDSFAAASHVPKIQPRSSNAPSNNLSLPENPFHDQTPPNRSSVVPHTGLDFPADEYPLRVKLPSRVSALETQLRMMNIHSQLQEREDLQMKTILRRPPMFADEFLQHLSVPMDDSFAAASHVPKIQPRNSNAPSNNVSLPENPFYDQTPPNGSSAISHTGLDFPVDEYPLRVKLSSRVSALETQLRMMNIHSHLQEREDLQMKTILRRPPLFADEFLQHLSVPPIGTSRSTSSVFNHGRNEPIDTPVSTKICSLAKSPQGSAELKQKILQNKPQILAAIVSTVKGHIYELIFNQSGSSFLQTLFESMADEYIEGMLRELLLGEESLRDACMHNFGNTTVIKLIRRLKSTYHQSIFTNIMKKYVMALTKSTLGNEVICECFNILSRQHIQILMREVVEKCFVVATDKVGCCILQLCMRYCDDNTICGLLIEVSKYALILSEHPYGNYVVQRVVELVKEGFVFAGILCKLEGHYVDMSMNKYASHVVEKCISDFPSDEVVRVVREIMDSPRFVNVCQNSFGNYVLQCAVKKLTGSILQELITCIDRYSTSLKSHPHARLVIKTANARRVQLSRQKYPPNH